MSSKDLDTALNHDEPTITDDEKEFSDAWAESDDADSGSNAGGEDDSQKDLDADGNLMTDHADGEGNTTQVPATETPAGDIDAGGDEDKDEIEQARIEAEKLQQRLRSAEGRLRNNHSPKLETEVETMRQQLQQIHDHLGIKQPEPADRRDNQDEDTIPDGFDKDAWEVFKRDYPENAKNLQSAAKPALGVDDRLAKLEAEREVRAQEEARMQFVKPIITAHPDYDEICQKHGPEVMEFVQSIKDPVKRQGAEVVIQQGSADQIIALVTEFKSWRAAKASQKTPTQKASTRDPSAAVAVPSRGGARPSVSASSKGNKDDYEGAWNEADVS